MIAFFYDKTFDGLLSAVFDAYSLRLFPDILLAEGAFVPLQYTVTHKTVSDPAKGERVFAGLKKRLAPESLEGIFHVWLSEETGADILLFRYMRAIFDAKPRHGAAFLATSHPMALLAHQPPNRTVAQAAVIFGGWDTPGRPDSCLLPSQSSQSSCFDASGTPDSSSVPGLSDISGTPDLFDLPGASGAPGTRPHKSDICTRPLSALRDCGQSTRAAQSLQNPAVCAPRARSANSRVMEVPLRADRNFCNTVILEVEKLADRVGREYMHWLGFVRFQQTRDTVYFSAIEPKYNILPLLLEHFIDRFSSQKWVIYDVRRGYGYYFDLETVQEMHMDPALLQGAQLDPSLLAAEEEQFQRFWERYCEVISIPERANPRLQQHFMPKRFWPYLTEKQKKRPGP